MEAEQQVVDQENHSPNCKPYERLRINGAQEEYVDGNGCRGEPGHHGHPPQLGGLGLRNEHPEGERGQKPYGNRHHESYPSSLANSPVDRGGSRGGQNEHQADDKIVPVGSRGLAGHIISSDEEGNSDEHEDEEGGDGEEVGEDLEFSEECIGGRCKEHGNGGMDGGACPWMHCCEPRKHVCSCNVSEVPASGSHYTN